MTKKKVQFQNYLNFSLRIIKKGSDNYDYLDAQIETFTTKIIKYIEMDTFPQRVKQLYV